MTAQDKYSMDGHAEQLVQLVADAAEQSSPASSGRWTSRSRSESAPSSPRATLPNTRTSLTPRRRVRTEPQAEADARRFAERREYRH